MVLLGTKEYLYFSVLAGPTSRYWLVLLLGTGWSSSVLAGPPQYWLVPSSHLSEPTIQRKFPQNLERSQTA